MAFVPVPPLTVLLSQSAFPKSDANLFEWAGTIEGAAGTVRRPEIQLCELLLTRVVFVDLLWAHVQDINNLPPKLSICGTNDQVRLAVLPP